MNDFYITTAIDYVNAPPHVGHAFEKVLADVFARWHRLKGYNVYFLTGTDENAQKNVSAAKTANLSVNELIDSNAEHFKELCRSLNISYDNFIRTSSKNHHNVVKDIFKKIYDKGEIIKGTYTGLYCNGCESFITEKDLINNLCPEHKIRPSNVNEECYFFDISKHKSQIISFVEKNVYPNFRANEILKRLDDKIHHLCISRKSDWGISCPVDESQKIYVWFDALLSYLSGSNNFFPADIHVIGKGINWFHSVIWPAILLAAELPLPKKIFIHGYLTNNNYKISKSIGNVIDPIDLCNKYTSDVVRWSLLRNSILEDSDYSEDILINKNNSELADKFGNLISRSTNLATKFGLEYCHNDLVEEISLDNYDINAYITRIIALIDKCNKFVEQHVLWKTKDQKSLFKLIDTIKHIIILLYPVLPDTCTNLAKSLDFNLTFKNEPLLVIKNKINPLFKKLEKSNAN